MKTDKQLQHDVLAELEWEPSIDATQVGVAVVDGIVTLTGSVKSFSDKWGIEHSAQQVDGVRSLAIGIDVMLPGMHERSDADIARAAENVLQWMTYAAPDRIKVKVEKGWITLTGTLDAEHQRHAAQVAVRHLMGVTGVSDQMTTSARAHFDLGPAPSAETTANLSSSEVKQGIVDALNRRAKTSTESIAVEVDGQHVTLRGNVNSWAERELAKRSAWSTQGVTQVTDYMTMHI
jgi:osmotically-inducible protein OsmY